jgi:hypothetical protein
MYIKININKNKIIFLLEKETETLKKKIIDILYFEFLN